jgi:uncharacterized cupin superfamily protein
VTTEPDIAFASLDALAGERFVSLRGQLGVESFGINLMALEPRQRGRIHSHGQQEEVYIVLEGELTLLVEGVEHTLGQGRVARVGPAARRQLLNAGHSRVLLIALGGSGQHGGRDAHAWESWHEGGEGRPPQEVPLPEDLPAG